jgi:hypothetical protein
MKRKKSALPKPTWEALTFGFGIHRPAPSRRDLAAAIDELLAGRPVTTPRTETAGCKINRAAKPNNESPVNFSNHVARILRDRCVACHREGEIAPFSLATYKEAAGWSEMIDEVVQGGRMPPWHASPEFGQFSNDCRLSEVLLDVPRYEFEWQNVYVLSEPKLMPEGSVLRCMARYDNSADNPSNPDPKKVVTWGEQTHEA